MRKDSTISIIAKDERVPQRTDSIPEPTVFLASNVNKSRFPSICNAIMYVVLFFAVIGVICLFIMMIIAWAFRPDTEVTTKPPFEPGINCGQPELLRNGECNRELLEDFDCNYDYPDCAEEHQKSQTCYLALQQSYISCSLALQMYLQYPQCPGIKICCPQLDLMGNGKCDSSIKNNFYCNYDMPDCGDVHKTSTTCPFPELLHKLSCDQSRILLDQVPSCSKSRLCCPNPENINNGVCNNGTKNDPECNFDYPDCNPDANQKTQICQYAKNQRQINCPNAYNHFGQLCNLKKCQNQEVTTETPDTTIGVSDTSTTSTTTVPPTTSALAKPPKQTTVLTTTTSRTVIALYPEVMYCDWYRIIAIGDGVCDEDLFNPYCEYDRNDCCATNTTFCADFVQPIDYSDKFLHLVGNGICNDATNVAEYNFDGGDCCGTNTTSMYPYCALCKCLKQENDHYLSWNVIKDHWDRFVVNNGMNGDLLCDEVLNNAENNFDGGDCCHYEFTDPSRYFYETFCSENCGCIGQYTTETSG